MNSDPRVRKDASKQMPVPELWRSTIVEIVDALKDGDTKLVRGVERVQSISLDHALDHAASIRASIRTGTLVNALAPTW